MDNKRQKEQQFVANSYTKPVCQLTAHHKTAVLQSESLFHYLYKVSLSELTEKAPLYGQDTVQENVRKNIKMMNLTGIHQVTEKTRTFDDNTDALGTDKQNLFLIG